MCKCSAAIDSGTAQTGKDQGLPVFIHKWTSINNMPAPDAVFALIKLVTKYFGTLLLFNYKTLW